MAKVNLTRTAFTDLAIAAETLVQFRGGRVQLADSATPLEDDWTTCSENMYLVLKSAKFARAVDNAVTFAVKLTP